MPLFRGRPTVSEPARLHPAPPGRSDTDPVAHSTGVVSESEHESLRADIRRLTTMLGRTLSHHGGPHTGLRRGKSAP